MTRTADLVRKYGGRLGNTYYVRGCGVRRFRADRVVRGLRAKGFSHLAIATALREEGRADLSYQTVQRHLRGACSCQ